MKSIEAVEGIKVGHASDYKALTGCTVILCEKGAIAGVDVRGSAPGTRETDLLNPLCTVDKVHAILLSGGSAFGLDAASGVMQYLEEKGHGFDVGVAKVPIVPAAVLFDLAVGDATVRPNAKMGYLACEDAEEGNTGFGQIGAGTGATVGKLYGFEHAMPSGIGTYSLTLENGVTVAALIAVNAVGDIRDSHTGEILAGARDLETGMFLDCNKALLGDAPFKMGELSTNTTIGVVATDAKLSKAEANKVAQMAHNGYARSISPVHTSMDGDTLFALSYGDKKASVDAIGLAASLVVSKAIESIFKEDVI